MTSVLLAVIVGLLALLTLLLWRLTKHLNRIGERYEQLTEQEYRTLRGEAGFLEVAKRTGLKVDDLFRIIHRRDGLETYKALLQRTDEIEARFAEDGDRDAAVGAKARAAYRALGGENPRPEDSSSGPS